MSIWRISNLTGLQVYANGVAKVRFEDLVIEAYP